MPPTPTEPGLQNQASLLTATKQVSAEQAAQALDHSGSDDSLQKQPTEELVDTTLDAFDELLGRKPEAKEEGTEAKTEGAGSTEAEPVKPTEAEPPAPAKTPETQQPAKVPATANLGEQEPATVPPTSDIPEEYSGAWETISKQMSNSAKEFVAARLRDLRVAKQSEATLKQQLTEAAPGQLPKQWYQHQQAYILDPNYQKVISENQTLSSYLGFYRDQLIKIKKGEDAEDLSIDPVTKQIVRVPLPATTENEILLTTKLNGVNQRISSNTQTAQQLQTGFATNVQQAFQAVKAVEDSFFPQYKDKPEILSTDPYMKEVMDQFKKINMEDNMFAPLVAKMYSAVETLYKEGQELRAQLTKAQKISETQKKAGPTSSDIQGADAGMPANPGAQEVNTILDKFDAIKKQAAF